MRKTLLALALAVPAHADVDCTDPYILARKVPECAGVQAADEEAAHQAAAMLDGLQDSPEFRELRGSDRAGRNVRGVLDSLLGGFDGGERRPAGAVVSAGAPPSSGRSGLASSAEEGAEEAVRTEVPPPDLGEPAADGSDKWYRMAEYAYHGVWAADLITTFRILRKGGYEMNPIYTLFGKTNLWGVILSIVVVHVLGTLFLRWLLRRMRASAGETRERWAKIYLAVLAMSLVSHGWGAVHNSKVLRNWRR